MKTIFRALMLALLLTAFNAVAVTPTFAQDSVEENIALYKKYTDNYAGTLDQKKTAIEAGKQYIEKYGAVADYVAQIEFLKKDVPRLEKLVADTEAKGRTLGLYKRFDTSLQGKTYDDTYASGREILAGNPELLDVIIVLGSIGFDESIKTPANTKYNTDTINYAKTAIQKIESGAKSDKYGAYQFQYGGVKGFSNARENALGWLNYNIGYLMYFHQNMKKEAIPYFYKATKYDSETKTLPDSYKAIGASYFDEAKRLSVESDTIAKAAGDKDTDESKAAYALAKGNADRAIDAYARAYKIASSNPSFKKEYKDGLYTVLQNLFKFRFNGKIEGLDSYVATVSSKPFPDPSTAVTPVIEVTPAATANSSLSSTSNTTGDDASAGSSRTASTKSVGSSTTVAETKATPAKAAAKTKAPAKKPAPKKKGTR